MAMMRRENISKDSKHDLISMERQKAVLELSLMTKRSEISKMDKAIAKEERQLRRLERTIEGDNLSFEEFLRENEKKSVEARTFFEREAKSKQEKTAKIKKLTAEIGTITSELAKSEEILVDYKRYKELLFKLSPPEWQEAQRAKASGARVLSVEDTRGEQKKQPVESAISNKGSESRASSPGRELPPLRETGPSSAHGDTRQDALTVHVSSPIFCVVCVCVTSVQEEPELYFSDPHQLLDLVTALTEQNLSLIQNSTRVEEAAEELRQSLGTARKKIENDEEQSKLQINDINQRINEEKARGNRLKQKVQLHVSLNSEDQDVMLDALGEKVAEVHRACVDDRVTNLSTLEKLASIENHLSVLLQSLESMPEESVAMMKKIKDSERRSRREANRIQRGGGSKYFRSSTTGEHYTIEFENLVESDEGEGESPQPCPRPISADEIKHLRDHRYTAITDEQILIDQKLHTELEAQEEKLRLEEEARNAAQREAARLARERKVKELPAQRTRGKTDGPGRETVQRKQTSGEEFDVYIQNVKAQSEAFRSNRLPSDTNVVTPNTECSWDFTTKTRSTNDDGTSLDLEWEDEEGINRALPAWERSRTEEDILRAALRPGGKPVTSGPASASEDSNALEWENDFVSTHPEDGANTEFEGFVNPVLDTPSEDASDLGLRPDNQDR
ncbi:putative coiled-coil domain-containing protein 37 [Scophthalmus maximus]|uniref:Putative coiled-coil domain-containing protein 37 n=1 Tax=Scophthalmus maximus TaxID=52904 RepID=A0A2U9C7D3_SCOMX|nr:putative coiled-coil domain-containing protein 37 [Scophthalmus maximus]